MSAADISSNPDLMDQRAGQYTSEADKMQEIITQMDTLVGQLAEEWKGSAAQSYTQRYNDLRQGFVDRKDLIDDIATSLHKSAEIIRSTDSQIAQAFRG